MVRDEIARNVHKNAIDWGDAVKTEMAMRGYDKVCLPQLNLCGYQSREWKKDFISENAASHWIANRCDNYNDGFDAGLEWCLMQLRAYRSKTDAVKRIKEELEYD